MKTPENFNHNPNVGLTPMAGGTSFYDASVLDYSKQPVGITSHGSTTSGKVNKDVLSFTTPDIGGTNMAK